MTNKNMFLCRLSALKPLTESFVGWDEYVENAADIFSEYGMKHLIELDDSKLNADDVGLSQLVAQNVFMTKLKSDDMITYVNWLDGQPNNCERFYKWIKSKNRYDPAQLDNKFICPPSRYVHESMEKYVVRLSRIFRYRFRCKLTDTLYISLYIFADMFYIGHQHAYRMKWDEFGANRWDRDFDNFKCPDDIAKWAIDDELPDDLKNPIQPANKSNNKLW